MLIAAICHASWTLMDAGVATGHTRAAWPSLATDLRNGGAMWSPHSTHLEANLITARRGDDVKTFTRLLVSELTNGLIQPVGSGQGSTS